ncbi:MAG: hypothetical protein Kow00121_52700 [Elainellaceae cyanobacterium]
MPKVIYSSLRSYGVAVVVVLLALLIMLALNPLADMSKSPFLLFLGSIVISAWYGGLKSGLLATFLSIFLSNYFFSEPTYTFVLDLPGLIRVAIYSVQGILISCICEALRTAKHRAEINAFQFQASEERFRLALRNSRISVFQQDQQLRYLWIYTPQGRSRNEAILGQSDYDLFPIEEADRLTAIKQQALETGEVVREEVCVTVSGELRYYDLVIQPVQVDGRYPSGVTCVCIDIGERRKIEQKLQDATRQSTQILESITDAFFAVDREWKFTYVNQRFEEFSHRSRLELLGQCIWDVFPQAVETELYQEYQRAIAEQVAVNVEARSTTNSEQWIEARAYPSPEGLSVYFQDITARKQADAERNWLLARERVARAEAETMQQRLTFLDKTSSALAASLDYETTLQTVVNLIVPEFADLCGIDLVQEDASTNPLVAIRATQPEVEALVRQLTQRYPLDVNDRTQPITEVLQTGKPQLLATVTEQQQCKFAKDAEHLALLRQLNIKSAMCVPLIAHEQVFGVLSIMRTHSETPYDVDDLTLAEEMGRRVGLAIENARLHYRLQQAIRQQEESLALLNAWLMSSPTAFAFFNPELRYIYANEALAAINGLPLSEHLGRTLWDVIPNWAASLEPVLRNVMETRQPLLNQEISGETNPPGYYRQSLVNYYPVCLPNGQLLGVGVTGIDVTDLKQTEQALRESETKFRSVVESNMIGIGFWNDSNQVEVNDALLQMLGYSRAEFEAGEIRWHDLTPPEYHHLDRQAALQVQQQGYCTPYEKEYIRKDGSRLPVLVGSGHFQGEPDRGPFFVLDISDRKRAEQARTQLLVELEAKQKLLETVIDQMPAGLAVMEATTGHLLLQNDQLRQILANEPLLTEQVEDYPYSYQVLWADGQLYSVDELPLMRSRRQGEVVHSEEIHLVWQNGDRKTLLVDSSPIHNPDGQIELAVATFYDITERQKAQEQIQLYADIVKNAQIGIAVWQLDQTTNVPCFRLVTSNLAASQIMGVDLPTVADRPMAEIFPAFSQTSLSQEYIHIIQTGQPQDLGEVYYSDEQITDAIFSLKAFPLPDRCIGIAFENITKRKRIEEALKTSEERFRIAQELSLDAFTVLRSVRSHNQEIIDFEWTYVNPTAAKILNRQIDQLVGQRLLELLPDSQTHHDLFNRYVQVVETGEPHDIELHYESEPVVGWFRNMAIKLDDGVAASFSDITNRKQAESEREQLLEREKAARTEAERVNRIKDEFLAVLSHELRSPLNPILGWAKLLRSRPFDDKARNRALEIIERNAKLQAQLIEDLLDVSRILRGKLTLNVSPVNLVIPIQGAIETVRLAAEAKTIQIHTTFQSKHLRVSGDAGRIQQIVWNLLSNAVKFTPTSGHIEVRLEQIDDQAQIVVSDSGKGIEPSFLPHMFDYFRQADSSTTRNFGGLGLGLAIVRHLTELHGGTVHAFSQGQDQGATLTVCLPLLKQNSQSAPDVETEAALLSSALLRGVRVLAVDDEADMRDYVAYVLQQAQAEVTIATSASEALTIFPQVKPDILLSDIGMPKMDGYMLLRQIRSLPAEQGGTVPAIALTAYAGEYDQRRAIAAGFQRHLPKPVEPDQLIQAIVQLIHSERRFIQEAT